MKKFILILCGFCLLLSNSYSQLNFRAISYPEALREAESTGKLIFLQFESLGCGQCNEVAYKAFEDKELAEELDRTFICIKITPDHQDRILVGALFNKKGDNFGSLFISPGGSLIHQYSKSTTRPESYHEQIDIALNKAGEGLKLSTLQNEYNSGNKSPGMMEMLMEAKKILALETDSLLDEYITILPKDSLQSVRTLLFIAGMAPILESRADSMLRKNYYQFINAWQKLPLANRVSTNNRIVYKSMQKAIREKNEAYAYKVAEFRKRTYEKNVESGQAAHDREMINYYRDTKDTVNCLIRLVYFYDKYYMQVSVDSIKRKDSSNLKALFAKEHATSSKDSSGRRKTVSYAALTQKYTRDLSNAALTFYQMTNDPLHLAKALQWSKRANEFSDSYEALDVHAKLLYKTGKKDEAIEWKSRAIALKKKRGFDTKILEKELQDWKK